MLGRIKGCDVFNGTKESPSIFNTNPTLTPAFVQMIGQIIFFDEYRNVSEKMALTELLVDPQIL